MSFSPPATLALAAVLTLLWAALSGGSDWPFGVAAIIAVLIVSQRLAPLPPMRISFPGLVRFLGFFLGGSVVGGVDVARRALSPSLPLEVRRHWHRLGLPPGPPRAVLIGAISLLPGTLSVHVDEDRLLIHSIAGEPSATIRRLEARVAALFALPPASSDDASPTDG